MRCVTIIPEIEIPGHTSPTIHAYPELGALSKTKETGVQTDIYDISNPKVEQFLQYVLTEVIDLFPSHMIHIGGDETPHKLWEDTPLIANFVIANQLPKAKDLQYWFISRISKFLQSKGCAMMGWNEITSDNILGETIENQSEKLADETVIQFWDGDIDLIKRSIEIAHKVVNTNHFSDYNEPLYNNVSIEKSYSFSPIPKRLDKKEKKNIWGLSCRKIGPSCVGDSHFTIFPQNRQTKRHKRTFGKFPSAKRHND